MQAVYPKSTTLLPPRGCTHFKLKQLGRVLGRHYETFVAPAGLKTTQYSLLSAIAQQGPLHLGELASAMRLTPSTLSRNLQPLLDQGLVTVQPGVDARSRVVQATSAGRALRKDAQRAWKRAQLALNARLGNERVAALHSLLDDCLNLLETTPVDDAHEHHPS
jgi:DNA-binding MarR family transcriptional regulator